MGRIDAILYRFWWVLMVVAMRMRWYRLMNHAWHRKMDVFLRNVGPQSDYGW